MDCDLTWPSRPFRHRVAQFLFQMHLTLFLDSIALYRLLPPTCLSKFKPFSQFTDVCHSCTVHAPNGCSALCIHENLLCVSKTCGWAAECRGQRGESNLWSECCHVQNPDCHARLPCCHVLLYRILIPDASGIYRSLPLLCRRLSTTCIAQGVNFWFKRSPIVLTASLPYCF